MPIDPWSLNASGGALAYSAAEMRLGTVVPFVAGAANAIGARSGVRYSGATSDLQVQAQTTPDMTVKVLPGVAIIQGSTNSGQGAYTWVLDATTNLTISAAHASLTRKDLIVARVRDADIAGNSANRDGPPPVVVTGTPGAGTPALPTDGSYLTLAEVTVSPSPDVTITAGDIADRRVFTAALGGCIPWSGSAPANMPPMQLNGDIVNDKLYVFDGAVNRRVLDDSMGKGLVYSLRREDGVAVLSGISSETTLLTRTVTTEPNRVYDVFAICHPNASVSNASVEVKLKVGAIQVATSGEMLLGAAGDSVGASAHYTYVTGPAETSTPFTVTVQPIAGGGTRSVIAYAGGCIEFRVIDIGGNTALVTAS